MFVEIRDLLSNEEIFNFSDPTDFSNICNGDTLKDIAKFSKQILALTLRNPMCPVEILQEFANYDCELWSISIAMNPGITEEIKSVLSCSSHPTVRQQLLSNPAHSQTKD